MNKTEAQQQLNNYARHQQHIQRHYIAPVMLVFAIFAFVFLVTGGFATPLTNLVLLGVSVGWIIYSRRLTAVSWRTEQHIKLIGVLFLGWVWVIVCNAYFVHGNPHGLPLSGLLGGVLAALPFLVLARTYRP